MGNQLTKNMNHILSTAKIQISHTVHSSGGNVIDWTKLIYYRNVYRKKILLSKPIICNPKSGLELHLLTGKRDFLNALWALKTFYHYSGLRPQLVIHGDGTLNGSNSKAFQEHFINCRIILRSEADDKIKTILKDYKFSLNYRFYNFRPQSIQLFDFQLLARTNRILMLDSDILFFQSPSQIIEYLKCGKSFFNSDPQDFYAVPRACMNGLFGLQVMEKVNIGLVYTPGKEYYELGLIERFLEEYYNNWQHNRLGIAQAGLTLIFSKHPDLFMRLSTSYCIGKGPITSEMICNHFASGFGRQYFYIRGLAYLKKQIFLDRFRKLGK